MANTPKGLLRGSKVRGKHSTMTPCAQEVILFCKRLAAVSKIVPGQIKPISTGTRHLKFTPIPGGYKIVVRGSTNIQELFIYTKDDNAPQKIEDEFMSN